jgi:hypothetical protein
MLVVDRAGDLNQSTGEELGGAVHDDVGPPAFGVAAQQGRGEGVVEGPGAGGVKACMMIVLSVCESPDSVDEAEDDADQQELHQPVASVHGCGGRVDALPDHRPGQ